MLLYLRDRLFVRAIIRQEERVDPRRHAILRRLITELDDLLDHLAFRLVQRSFFLGDLEERAEFFVGDPAARRSLRRGESPDDRLADAFQREADAIEQRHQRAQGENADRGEAIRRGERDEFWDEIAEQNDNGEDRDRREPLGQLRRGERAFPEHDEAEDDERDIDDRVAEQEHVEDAARVIAKRLDEVLQRRMSVLEPSKLVRLERKQRRLQAREQRRETGERRDDREEQNETADCHSAARRRSRAHLPRGKFKRAGLPLILDGSKLRRR